MKHLFINKDNAACTTIDKNYKAEGEIYNKATDDTCGYMYIIPIVVVDLCSRLVHQVR